jgi:hypothetical protein
MPDTLAPRAARMAAVPLVVALALGLTACDRPRLRQATPTVPLAAPQFATVAPSLAETPTVDLGAPNALPTDLAPTQPIPTATQDAQADQIEQQLNELESTESAMDDFPDLP